MQRKNIIDKHGDFHIQLLKFYMHHCKVELKKKYARREVSFSCYVKSFMLKYFGGVGRHFRRFGPL